MGLFGIGRHRHVEEPSSPEVLEEEKKKKKEEEEEAPYEPDWDDAALFNRPTLKEGFNKVQEIAKESGRVEREKRGEPTDAPIYVVPKPND